MATSGAPGGESGPDGDSERWLVVDGRRWRRADPSLPPDVVDALTSQLGRARSAVGAARRSGDDAAVAAARRRVSLAKHGLGERGPYWWDEPEPRRLARARAALEELHGDHVDGVADPHRRGNAGGDDSCDERDAGPTGPG